MKKTSTLCILIFASIFAKGQTFTDTLHLDGNLQFAALPAGVLNNASVFTVEFWVKTQENGTSGTYWQRPFLAGLATDNDNSGDFGISTDNGYIGMWEGFSTVGTDQYFESPTVKINDNLWHHIAAVNNGTEIYMYVDGKIIDSLTSGLKIGTAVAPLTIGAASLDFGSYYSYTAFPSSGTFAEFRVSDTVRYSANFTPSTSFTSDAHTLALYDFAGQCGVKIKDLSANQADLTANSGAPSCSTLPYNSDLSFNGVNQYIKLPQGFLNNADTFTIETWFKSTDLNTNNTYYQEPTIFGIENSGGNSGDFGLTTQYGYLVMWNDMGGSTTNVTTKSFVCDGNWHHIAACASGTSIAVFVDGVYQSSFTIARGLNTASEALTFMRLNSQSLGGTAYHAGELDEIRISNNARYTANFTPNIGAFGTDSHTLALYHLDACGAGTTADASGNNQTADVFNITACGTLPPQLVQGKILYSHHNSYTTNAPDSIYALDSSGKKYFVTLGFRPRLSHGGRYLAFSNGPNPNNSYGANLWIRDLTTQDEGLIVSNNDYLDYYDFYPSDERLVYSQGCSIYTTNIDGSASYTNLNAFPSDCFSDDPTIRIKDSVIAYHNVHNGLFTMNGDGSSPTQVPNTVPGDLNPSWSPDGQWLAYYKPIPGSYNGGAGAYVPTNSVYKIKVDGSDSTRLSFFGINDTLAPDPIWAKDMNSLYVTGRIRDTMGIYQISTDGSGQYHLVYMFDTLGAVQDYWLGLSDSIKTGLLPVNLLNFTAAYLGKTVLLNWQTAQEVNSNYFDVERSTNGSAFAKIGSVAAKGNSSITSSYNFTDYALPLTNNNIYYRLKQVDKNGAFTYSHVVTVNLQNVTATVVYPNPSKGVFTIVTKNSNQKLEVVIHDVLGRQVYHQVYANTNAALVNMQAVPGVYIVSIFDGKTTINKKVAIQ